ncbi:hypothetical protein PHYSODRAFT_300895 [Phytophthora sojae]|uniref:BZIP domain-containing protein n=1 Tax=Phytophthora sojae (strain P6497) TaxID=1094619 RepID=G4ZHI6_PHYSP|nr:hypothetical protein PHYSODRAFT_300895 [Phytophthora sojae]EGZ18066.1 hypothetical protein PHYSODRAFT_300895 [Phytophthora sojae]|eukprot:XP_009527124.1 hypothetical protein PHYSODRAFT_300895 [Phytophthora sojae]
MAESSLVPPNSSSLSDSIVGGVLQRVVPLHGQRAPINDRSFQNHKRLRVRDDTEQAQETRPVTPARKMKVSASRRERCRVNQAKYRQRQWEHADELEASISELKEAIKDLEDQRGVILARIPTNPSLWVVATEYFRLFSRGYMMPLLVSDLSSFEAEVHHPKEIHAQLTFLKETMALDVTDGDACGVEAILEMWRLFSLHHSDLVSDESVLATTSTRITITDHTVRALYPHLLETEARGRFSLAGMLLNKRLVIQGTVRFDWDETSGRVVRLESKMDMVTPLLKLLGALDKVAAVFDNARITPEGSVISSKQEGL